MEELKTCPFCGEDAELVDCEIQPRYFVRCTNYRYCGIEQEICSTSKQTAIKRWNRRAKDE